MYIMYNSFTHNITNQSPVVAPVPACVSCSNESSLSCLVASWTFLSNQSPSSPSGSCDANKVRVEVLISFE